MLDVRRLHARPTGSRWTRRSARSSRRRPSSWSRWCGTRAGERARTRHRERLAVSEVADPEGHLVHHATVGPRRRAPRRSTRRSAPARSRTITGLWRTTSRSAASSRRRGARPVVLHRADARRPLRPRDGQRAGRRASSGRSTSTSGCSATGRSGAAGTRTSRSRASTAGGGHARRRGLRVEPARRGLRRSTTFPDYVNDVPGFDHDVRRSTAPTASSTASGATTTIEQLLKGFDTPARIPYQERVVEEVIRQEGFGKDDVPRPALS